MRDASREPLAYWHLHVTTGATKVAPPTAGGFRPPEIVMFLERTQRGSLQVRIVPR